MVLIEDKEIKRMKRIKRVCAWCGKELKYKREGLGRQISRLFSQTWKKVKGINEEEVISHGICNNCERKLLQSIDEE